MSKLSEHPLVVMVTVFAGIAGILTYYHDAWNQSPTGLPSSQEHEPEWWIVDTVGKHPKITAFFVDKHSIKSKGQLRSSWTMFRNTYQEDNGVIAVKALGEFDCSQNKARYIQYESFYIDGTNSILYKPESEFQNVVSDSSEMVMFNFVCFGLQPSSRKVPNNDPRAEMQALKAGTI